MRVTLAQPGGFDYTRDPSISVEAPLTPPLALGYLKAYAQSHDPSLEIQIIEPWALEPETPDTLAQKVVSTAPRVAGFSCYVWNVERVVKTARLIKERDTSIFILLGGPEAYNLSNLLTETAVDAVVVGPGEKPFTAFLHRFALGQSWEDVPGVTSRSKPVNASSGARPEPSLETIPGPYASGVFELSRYRHAYMETYRGCAQRCAYCFYPKKMKGLGFASPATLAGEVKALAQAGTRYVILIDSIFNLWPWAAQVCGMVEENRAPGMEFSADIMAELVTEKFCRAARRAGFVEFQAGLQSVNPLALENIHRRLNRQKFERGARLLRDYGFRVNVDLILGLPGDDMDDVWRGVEYLQNLPVDDIRVALLRVLPGTGLWENQRLLGLEFDNSAPYYLRRSARINPGQINAFFDGGNHRVYHGQGMAAGEGINDVR
ncbi:MAG: B12-binding domain-containing radical SAM protein [Nitrospinae bacterium]|nr:B12-binding domain-containing radical SAM protein [Nitrospinota bacterium]